MGPLPPLRPCLIYSVPCSVDLQCVLCSVDDEGGARFIYTVSCAL